jgi:hypothetical protein
MRFRCRTPVRAAAGDLPIRSPVLAVRRAGQRSLVAELRYATRGTCAEVARRTCRGLKFRSIALAGLRVGNEHFSAIVLSFLELNLRNT